MNREELKKTIEEEMANILDTFERKNRSYGRQFDAFYNFRQTAQRFSPDWPEKEGMFKVMLILKDKHDVALANRGINDAECAERLRDIIVYCLIGLAMIGEERNRR